MARLEPFVHMNKLLSARSGVFGLYFLLGTQPVLALISRGKAPLFIDLVGANTNFRLQIGQRCGMAVTIGSGGRLATRSFGSGGCGWVFGSWHFFTNSFFYSKVETTEVIFAPAQKASALTMAYTEHSLAGALIINRKRCGANSSAKNFL